MLNNAAFFLIGFLLGNMPSTLSACASCGSGSSDPIFLNPAESLKTIAGIRAINISDAVNSDGDLQKNYLVQKRSYVDIGAAYRFAPRLQLGLYTGAQQNIAEDQVRIGVKEPFFAGRFTVLNQNFVSPMIPQIQVLFGYKPDLFADKYASKSQTYVDVFGSGYHEITLGYDIWNAMTPIMWGVSQSFTYSLPKYTDEDVIQQSSDMSSILTFGKMFASKHKFLAGVSHRYKFGRYENHNLVADSDAATVGCFITYEGKITQHDDIRLVVNLSGYLNSYQTSRSQALTLSWLRSIM